MAAVVSSPRSPISQNTNLSPGTKAQYLQWLRREAPSNEHSVFGFSSDAERMKAIAESVQELGVMLRPKTPGRPPSSGKEKQFTPDPDERKAASRYQTFGIAATPVSTPRPKSANPKTIAFFTHFTSGFPKSLNMSVHKQMPFFQELHELLVQPMSQIQQNAGEYKRKHSWEEAIHLEIGCAMLHALQGAFGKDWDPDARIKNAWASAYHHLIFGGLLKQEIHSSHARAPIRHKLKAYGGMIRPTKAPFYPSSKPSRTLGLPPAESFPATAAAAASEPTITQTHSPTTTPSSDVPFVPSLPSAPSPESCCVIL